MPRRNLKDQTYMLRALALAVRGQGSVEPNPMVGCVLVRNGRVIGEGYHRRFGGPHAEVEAIRSVRGSARGASAYVTLEPCCHFGKTPPCTNALIDAGITRVVAAMADPFPKVRGKGVRQLRAAGIKVEIGLMEEAARQVNAPYLKRQRTGRPWVILKWAQSIDGKIATRTGDSKWISGDASRRLVHEIRGRVDAVVVGVGTVVADDPQLTCRGLRARRVAARVVLDPSVRTPVTSQLVRTAAKVPTMLVAATGASRTLAARRLVRKGVELVEVGCSKNGLALRQLLDELGRRGMTNVLVEGGGKTLGAFYDAGLADEALIFVSPRLIGGQTAPSALSGLGPAKMSEVRTPSVVEASLRGNDLVYHLR